ncbi:MAG: phosphatase PAP2 family protein [Rickettsiales bacterium]|jgi:membrane-associated phospholipid phosphatase|nr:phosphatase PAP2 family protein [Rickettsiales bacterium]
MFLIDDFNRLSLPRILAGAGAVAAFVFLGIWFLDYPLFTVMRYAGGWFWEILAAFGSAKFMLFASFALFLFKMWSTGIWGKNPKDMAWFIMSGRSDFLTVGAGIFSAVFMALLVSLPLKFFIGRLRPVFFESMFSTGFYPMSLGDQFHSLPSGGAAAGFAALVLLGLFFPDIKKYAWALAVLLGVAQIVVGAHFPSDVVLGAFIGMLSADIIYLTFKRAAYS